jgi:hypothetical protein
VNAIPEDEDRPVISQAECEQVLLGAQGLATSGRSIAALIAELHGIACSLQGQNNESPEPSADGVVACMQDVAETSDSDPQVVAAELPVSAAALFDGAASAQRTPPQQTRNPRRQPEVDYGGFLQLSLPLMQEGAASAAVIPFAERLNKVRAQLVRENGDEVIRATVSSFAERLNRVRAQLASADTVVGQEPTGISSGG